MLDKASIETLRRDMGSETDTVVDYTIEALREAIRSGRLAQGQRLIVADITRMFSVSAGPVREAIRRLTGEGLIEIIPHRGASVREISREDMREIFELREAIEGLAASRAATRGNDPGYRAQLKTLLHDADDIISENEREKYLENNRKFHNLIYEMANNGRLNSLASQLILPVYQLRLPERMPASDMATSHMHHQAIAEAILACDQEAARAAMVAHLRWSGECLMVVVSDMISKKNPRTPSPRPGR